MPPRPFIFLLLLLLGVTVAWQFGDQSGFQRGVAEGMTAVETVLDSAPEPPPPVSEVVETLTRERDIALATLSALREEIVEAEAVSATDRAELDLYRRIGRDDAPTGLGIDSLVRVDGKEPSVRVTLVQSRGRSRAGGRLVVSVVPTATASTAEEDKVSPRAGKGEPVRFDDERMVWEVPFDLRFFQTLEVPLSGLADGETALIRVDVIPTIGPHKAFRRHARLAELTAN